ncbi:hypothetical protein NC651_004564 [Populus alba x Populus x berolinensis]|nr:hypothetical protein NC651_004564 [Populus alba x Populus x berolinensis]
MQTMQTKNVGVYARSVCVILVFVRTISVVVNFNSP